VRGPVTPSPKLLLIRSLCTGLPGGTRSGSIDASLIFHHTPDCSETVEWSGRPISKAEFVLNKESGFKGECSRMHFALRGADLNTLTQPSLDRPTLERSPNAPSPTRLPLRRARSKRPLSSPTTSTSTAFSASSPPTSLLSSPLPHLTTSCTVSSSRAELASTRRAFARTSWTTSAGSRSSRQVREESMPS